MRQGTGADRTLHGAPRLHIATFGGCCQRREKCVSFVASLTRGSTSGHALVAISSLEQAGEAAANVQPARREVLSAESQQDVQPTRRTCGTGAAGASADSARPIAGDSARQPQSTGGAGPVIPHGGPLPGKHRLLITDIEAALLERGIFLRGKKSDLYHKLRTLIDAEAAASGSETPTVKSVGSMWTKYSIPADLESADALAPQQAPAPRPIREVAGKKISINGVCLSMICQADFDFNVLTCGELRAIGRALGINGSMLNKQRKAELIDTVHPHLRSEATAEATLRELAAMRASQGRSLKGVEIVLPDEPS